MAQKLLKQKVPYILILLFALLVMMYWNDVSTSQQAGLKEVNRSVAHTYIALVVGFHALYLIFRHKVSMLWRSSSIMLLLIFIWFVFVDYYNNVSISISGPMLLLAIWWYLTYNFVYAFCYYNSRSLTWLLLFFVVIFFVWVYLNLYARNQIMTYYDRENAVTGYAYYLLILLPFIMLIKKTIFQKILMGIAIAMILTSYKRGTLVTLPVMLLVFYFVKIRIEKKSIFNFLKYVVIISVTAFILVPLVNNISGGFLYERFSEEELERGSGRTEQRQLALREVSKRGYTEYLIGSGHGASVRLLNTGIHNEWVEFLYSFGLVGLILYFILGVFFLRQCYKAFRRKSPYAPHMFMMMAYFYMVSIFSGFIGLYVTYYFFAFMGLVTYLDEKALPVSNDKVYEIS